MYNNEELIIDNYIIDILKNNRESIFFQNANYTNIFNNNICYSVFIYKMNENDMPHYVLDLLYFPLLKKLTCSNTKIIKIINIPNSLKILHCHESINLSLISGSSKNIEELYCSSKFLLKINNVFSNLTTLHIVDIKIPYCFNNIHKKDKFNQYNNLSNKLLDLNCCDKNISHLNYLPSSLIKLNASNNKLENIQNLPNQLNILICNNNNKIKNFKKLPNSLTYLEICSNKISKLDKFPLKLKVLQCSHNNLTELNHITRYKNLEELYFSNNKVTRIQQLPNSIISINCSSNLISRIKCKPINLKYINCSFNFLKIENVFSEENNKENNDENTKIICR